jgi:hypothetical protein
MHIVQEDSRACIKNITLDLTIIIPAKRLVIEFKRNSQFFLRNCVRLEYRYIWHRPESIPNRMICTLYNSVHHLNHLEPQGQRWMSSLDGWLLVSVNVFCHVWRHERPLPHYIAQEMGGITSSIPGKKILFCFIYFYFFKLMEQKVLRANCTASDQASDT